LRERERKKANLPMANTLLQINLNRARAAQDLLDQYAAERDASIMVISEPYRVLPDNPCWAAARVSHKVDVAIAWRRSKDPLPREETVRLWR